jgi:hypothetical protein
MAYHRYNPNQPRVPAGHPDGGQWTDGGYRQNPRIQTAFLRGRTSPFFELGARVRSLLARRAAEKNIEAGLALFAALSLENSRDKRAVITLKAREYHGDKTGAFDLEGVFLLDRERIKDICKRLEDVQRFTDEGASAAARKEPVLNPREFGNEVHKYVEIKVNAEGKPNFLAEKSIEKTKDDGATGGGKETEPADVKTERTRGGNSIKVDGDKREKRSIRVDVYEKVKDKTVCVYDIKTGRRGLDFARRVEIIQTIFRKFGKDVRRIILMEIRPTHPRAPR